MRLNLLSISSREAHPSRSRDLHRYLPALSEHRPLSPSFHQNRSDFFAGKSDRFWWNDGLKGRCSLNAGKYLCKSLDLEGCASLEDIERRLSLILGDLYDFDLQTPKMTRKSEGSHQLVLFV